jgi:hypothetical protein
MATTFTIANLGQKGLQHIDPTKKPGRGILVLKERILDIDKFPTVAASDSYQCIEIKGGETVIDAGIDILKVATAAGGSADLDFAKGDTFLDGLDTDDIALPTNTDRSTSGGEHITLTLSAGTSNSDTLDVTFSAHSPAGGIFRVWALVHRLGPVAKVGS